MRCLAPCLIALVAFSIACPERPPRPAAVIPLVVDDALVGEVLLPAGPGPWPLLDHLPLHAPPLDAWSRVTVEGPDGRVFTRRDPSGTRATEEARFYRRGDGIAFAYFVRATPSSPRSIRLKAENPSLVVPSPAVVRVHTSETTGDTELPLLRITRAGVPAGRIQPAEWTALDQFPEPGRPQQSGARLTDVLALRGGVDDLVLQGDEGEQPIMAASLDAGLHLLKPSPKRGWVYTHFEGETRSRVVRGITAIDIAPPDDEPIPASP